LQFEYLVLADAANNAPDGKVNVLGLGARIVTVERLPATLPLALLGLVSGSPEEAGDYEARVTLEEPDGTKETIVEFVGKLNADADPRVPTGIGMLLNIVRPFRIAGIHRFEMTVGDLTSRYDLLVRMQSG
jgi:hypothetical protein